MSYDEQDVSIGPLMSAGVIREAISSFQLAAEEKKQNLVGSKPKIKTMNSNRHSRYHILTPPAHPGLPAAGNTAQELEAGRRVLDRQ